MDEGEIRGIEWMVTVCGNCGLECKRTRRIDGDLVIGEQQRVEDRRQMVDFFRTSRMGSTRGAIAPRATRNGP